MSFADKLRDMFGGEDWNERDNEFRSHHTAAGRSDYDRHRPAYQYGYAAAYNPDYRGKSFDQIETNRHEVIACFPFPRSRELFKNVDCMLASTRFWQPLLNGYSSFTPPSYRRHAAALAAFPLEGSIQYLRQLGVTKVIVFAGQVSAPRLSQISHHPDLSLWKADESVRIYVISERTPSR